MCDKRPSIQTKVVENENEVSTEVGRIIECVSADAIQNRGIFTVGLSGGSLIKILKQGLPNIKTDYTKWKLFFCDERHVPQTSPDSTMGQYHELLKIIPLDIAQFITVDTSLSVDAAAADYEAKIRTYFPDADWPKFDLLLLGAGPDGHTASLFPGHKLLDESKLWVAPIDDSPKPPPCRVTLTFPVINNARNCLFASCGQGKADILKRILKDKDDLPAGRVQPSEGKVLWIMDKEAGSKL